MKTNCICVIPARGGSTRIPLKNIRMFHGKPILAYSIQTAIDAQIFDRIIVSTDDVMIAQVAKLYGAEVIMRNSAMSQNEIGTQEVMKDVLKDIECLYACCLYPCAPMLSPKTLRLARSMVVSYPYIVPVATWLQDPGQFYFGKRTMFTNGVSLLGNTQFIRIPKETECDINTQEDWKLAEEMYVLLHKEQK